MESCNTSIFFIGIVRLFLCLGMLPSFWDITRAREAFQSNPLRTAVAQFILLAMQVGDR